VRENREKKLSEKSVWRRKTIEHVEAESFEER
jgi:hypothetical protein